MANGVVIRFKADSTEYDAKLKRSIEQMRSMEEQAKKLNGSIDRTDEGYVKFIQSLGRMETIAKSSKTALREYSEAILYLTQQYKNLSETEKQGDVGKAMAESIQQLKVRAAEAQDTIGDLNEELKHMASDTAFTDGISLMTRTIGSCAAAITAWTGDSKEMDAVIKDLAKIGTTVAAVDALTKAFQKQNLVLLKNPYVLAAAGAVALAVALGKLYKSLNEVSAVEKDLQEVQAKGREDSAKEITRIDALNNILRDNTRSLDERKAALSEIQALVPNYHGALTTEGNLINDNTDALTDYVNELQRAATAQAAFDRMVEINKQKLAKQVELKGATANSARASQAYQDYLNGPTAIGSSSAGTSFDLAVGSTLATEALVAKNAVDEIQDAIDEYDAELQALQGLIDGNTLSTGGTKAIKGGSGGSDKSGGSGLGLANYLEMPAAGSLADLERQAAIVQASMKNATTPEEYKEMQDYLDTIIAKMKELKGEIDITFAPGSMNDLQQQLREAQTALANMTPESEGWAEALELVRAKMQEVASLQDSINQKTTVGTVDAKANSDAWQNAVSAVGQLGGALQSIEDPAAKVAGIIAQAIANVALTFASSLKGTVSPWDWIAAAIAGTATMISTIAAIKSATKGYAGGGMVEGTSYSGDNIVARLNAGEGVLTAKGVENAENMASIAEGRAAGAQSTPYTKGEYIFLGVNNYLGRSGRGELVTTKMLKRAGINL